jgi:hypothetical protein
VAVSKAVSSASIVDLVNMVCLDDLHDTAPPPKVNTYPLVALMSSTSEIQFASLNTYPRQRGPCPRRTRPSRLQQPTIRERPEPASCDASVKDSVKRSVFLCCKKISPVPRLNFANRGARVVTCRDERGGGGARVWHFSSHSLTKWCNTSPYMLVYISLNFPCGTKLSSHILSLCSQKLGLHFKWAYTHELWDFYEFLKSIMDSYEKAQYFNSSPLFLSAV